MANEDREYTAWVRTLRCRMWMQDPCMGRIEAHHAGRKGMSQRAHDDTCVPLCLKHHRNWHDASGVFKHMKKAARREWAERQINWTRDAYEKR